ncbi:hypothetical protein BOX15_Mlig024289g1 [Macrostomum lignano]|uniref:Tyrosine-protein kinase ephrin type A/B receptor-like domain-containing protein n=1 Tax=Macrostomum lignano TaxID=282301 RepID=A0A267FHD0_9PLAT|nr:hypothetical protein BOX15_Mlig024289g1 [Macrostomum lignano]
MILSNLIEIFGALLLLEASLGEATEVTPCQPGQYWSERYQACRNCPDGYYQDKPGQKYCYECPDGHKCPAPKTKAIPCPPGMQSNNGFLKYRISCASCSDGYYQDKPGQKYCHKCPDGHKCPAPKTKAIPCPPGMQSNNGFLKYRISCASCSDGYYQDKPGQKYCHKCPDGHKCPAPKTKAIPCPPGMQSNNGFIEYRINCASCSDGYYQDKPGQRQCLPCPLGRHCPAPKNRAIPCPSGTVSRYHTNDRVNCATCSDGYYQDKIGQSKCVFFVRKVANVQLQKMFRFLALQATKMVTIGTHNIL